MKDNSSLNLIYGGFGVGFGFASGVGVFLGSAELVSNAFTFILNAF